jgi:TonB-dependent starch-binding outer membrane protein SusC
VKQGGNINDPNELRPASRRVDPQWVSGNQPTYDPQKYAFQTAPIQNQSLSLSGGSENTDYFISLDHLNQEGIAKGTGFKRYSVRTNLNTKINNRIKLGLNLSPSYSVQVDRNTEGKDNNLNLIARHPSMVPFDYYWNPGRRVIANDYLEYYGGLNVGRQFFEFDRVPDNRRRAQILSNAFVDVNILENLHFRSSIGLIYNGLDRQRFYTLEAGQGTIQSDRWNAWATNWLWENTLNYTKSIGKHSFSLLGGYSSQKDYSKSTSMSGRGQANDLSETINNATVISSWGENVNEWSLISMLGRATYNFDDRYLLTGSVRRDGSSRFGANNKWGVFPSISGAWRISQETFMKGSSRISNLKLRASWGLTGNNRIGNYSAIANLNSANTVLGVGEMPQAGLLPGSLSNPELGWERSRATNIGLDLGLFNDRLNITMEAYRNITTDLLLNVPIPLVSGFNNQLQNIGKVGNKGLEMDISTRNTVGAFAWNTRFNVSLNKNEVLKMGPNDTPIITGEWYASTSYTGVGHPIGAYYMHVQDGIFQNQSEVDQGPLWSNEGVGDVRIKDVNGDGKLDNNDRDFVGQPYPIWVAGLTNEFRFKNFDMSVFINAAGGHKTFFIVGRYYDRSSSDEIKSYTANWNNRWRSESQPGDGRTPNALSTATTNGGFPTTRWLYDSDWWRLKNITLGYTLPQNLTKHVGISSLRVYATGDNLFLGTKYPGYNPEGVSVQGESVSQSAGYDYGVYPLSRRVVFGLNVNF